MLQSCSSKTPCVELRHWQQICCALCLSMVKIEAASHSGTSTACEVERQSQPDTPLSCHCPLGDAIAQRNLRGVRYTGLSTVIEQRALHVTTCHMPAAYLPHACCTPAHLHDCTTASCPKDTHNMPTACLPHACCMLAARLLHACLIVAVSLACVCHMPAASCHMPAACLPHACLPHACRAAAKVLPRSRR